MHGLDYGLEAVPLTALQASIRIFNWIRSEAWSELVELKVVVWEYLWRLNTK